jgi:hypothetical protein
MPLDDTPLGLPLPHPDNNPREVDVPRLRTALTMLDTLVSELQTGKATMAEVNAAISAAIAALLDGAPEALDTLYEIAAKLGVNDDVVATILETLGTKANAADVAAALTAEVTARTDADALLAPKASPTFTGTVTLPDGTAISAASPLSMPIKRSARTANAQLVKADGGKLIDITSGTFTQTFAAAATLGAGWWVYFKNSGTGDVTLDPNGSETIDGLASFISYPGELRVIYSDGAQLLSFVINGFSKTFTASASFIKPPGYSWFQGLAWSAGGGGRAVNGGDVRPGAGGGCWPFLLPAAKFASSTSVQVGAGGARGVSGVNSGIGGDGGDTVLGSFFTIKGGRSGGTAGAISPDDTNALSGSTLFSTGFEASGLSQQTAFNLYGGGFGNPNYGGMRASSSIYGGAAGGFFYSGQLQLPGFSKIAGNGGAASAAGVAGDGEIPAGGGGATQTGTAGNGARGELRIMGVI